MILYIATAATAIHCFANVGSGELIIPMNTARQIVRPPVEYIIIFLRPNRSIVLGVKNDPIAKHVFMTAARS